jgi:hypothetical protein
LGYNVRAQVEIPREGMRTMEQTVAKVRGRLSADGKLELAERLGLGEGDVDVIVRRRPRAGERPREGVVEVLRRIQEERRALGIPGRTREKIDAEIREGREGDEERLLAIERLQEECARARGERQCPPQSECGKLPETDSPAENEGFER